MITQLTPDEVRDMTLEEKDRWWLEKVWRGNMPQLTIRSGLAGALIGGLLCLTNLYIGIKTGWALGVGITSVIISFAMFKALSKVGLGNEMTILENNAMQSCATAAGYMTGPLVASVPAYMMVTNQVIPMWQVITWVIGLAILGVLFAFPLKKRFINDEQLPFPEGKACGVVLDGLHSDNQQEGILKAKILALAGLTGALIKFMSSGELMAKIKLAWLALPEMIEDQIYLLTNHQPTIRGSELQSLTIGIENDAAMFAAGGLMGIKTGVSLIVGGVINYFLLAPWLIEAGIIQKATFKAITMWSLWGGVAMMATASIFAFASKPQQIISAFSGIFSKKKVGEDILKHIELPMSVFVVGIPIISILIVIMAKYYFNVNIWLGVLAIPLVFVFTLIGVNSTALTSITPSGALGKLTQVTYAVLAPGNTTTNLMTAGITAEVATNASNLLMDIKPGYMLGAKPRHQAIAHVIGAVIGTCVAVPVFYAIFGGNISIFGSKEMLMPSATIWKAVADVLAKGLGALHPTAQIAVVIGAILGIVMEAINVVLAKRASRIMKAAKDAGVKDEDLPSPMSSLPVSAVGMGLAFIIPFATGFNMALGAVFFWTLAKIVREHGRSKAESFLHRIGVQNQETLCAGVIAGAALMGIIVMAIKIRM